jgi:hypothetical protein
MRDEAEIKGHRRTYIGAMPGKFIQAMKTAGTEPGDHARRDRQDRRQLPRRPGLGPARGARPGAERRFLDHYLDVRFDLSKVLFVCTANQLDTIPGPLLDRMEVIRLSGYIAEEKLQIAKPPPAAAPAQARRPESARQLKVDRQRPARVIEGYAREAGVRRWRSSSARSCARPWSRSSTASRRRSVRPATSSPTSASRSSATNARCTGRASSPGWPGPRWAARHLPSRPPAHMLRRVSSSPASSAR